MSSGILGQVFHTSYTNKKARQNAFEVWMDLLSYAKNLKGNWLVSQEIFHNYIAPTAIEHPAYFASCVEDMVKLSGIKIKCKQPFFKSIKFLKTFKKNRFESELVIKTITELLNSGLYEPLYAERAIKFAGLTL